MSSADAHVAAFNVVILSHLFCDTACACGRCVFCVVPNMFVTLKIHLYCLVDSDEEIKGCQAAVLLNPCSNTT